MNNYCAKHKQFYSDYCVYCGNPIIYDQRPDSTQTFIIKLDKYYFDYNYFRTVSSISEIKKLLVSD
ncbi:MAG: hypothetical protein AABY22_31825 [Nanoarchaeota archaeon]